MGIREYGNSRLIDRMKIYTKITVCQKQIKQPPEVGTYKRETMLKMRAI